MRAWSEKPQISRTFLAGDSFHTAAAAVYVQDSSKRLVENLEGQETHTHSSAFLIPILEPAVPLPAQNLSNLQVKKQSKNFLMNQKPTSHILHKRQT
jgi:hypothetical protein